jgi:Fe2+ transport system protein FeoA
MAAADGGCPVCPLSTLGCGVVGHVVGVSGATPAARRLLALGLRPGTTCCVLGRAPAGGPLHVRAGSVHLMLRAHEAATVSVAAAGEGLSGDLPPL